MVTNFFVPGLGGVEMHVYNVSQQLIKMGHKVIVLTQERPGTKAGIRYLANGLKVYYFPMRTWFDSATFMFFTTALPLYREIFLRERIDIVHNHQATGPIGMDGCYNGKTMGLRICFTDHSLFGFADAGGMNLNYSSKLFFTEMDHAMAVSHTNRENLVLRTDMPPQFVSVVCNAVDSSKFTPARNPGERDNTLTLVAVSRLTYRKGTDLLAAVIPAICAKHPHVRWVIGGDGPKRLLLEEMRDRYNLHDRVEMLGAVPNHEVPKLLRRGHIFVNPSLTEAFCIAMVEASNCGLLVVSTAVGGVPEVLPPDMARLCEADPDALEVAIDCAIKDVEAGLVDPEDFHLRASKMYSWEVVARKVEKVYWSMMAAPAQTFNMRVDRVLKLGPLSGFIWLLNCICAAVYLLFLDFFFPRHEIEIAPDFPTKERKKAAEERVAAQAEGEWGGKEGVTIIGPPGTNPWPEYEPS